MEEHRKDKNKKGRVIPLMQRGTPGSFEGKGSLHVNDRKRGKSGGAMKAIWEQKGEEGGKGVSKKERKKSQQRDSKFMKGFTGPRGNSNRR